MKWCKTCGRPKHIGLCNMVELSDGRTVHATRIDVGGDLHDQLGEDLKISNRWIKKLEGKISWRDKGQARGQD